MLAFLCGFVLGAAQFFLLKEIVTLCLIRHKSVTGLVLAKLGLYLLAAVAVVVFLRDYLLPAGIGLGSGVLVLGIASFLFALHRESQKEKQQDEQTAPPSENDFFDK